MPPIDVKELSAILQDKHDQTATRLRGDLEAHVDTSITRLYEERIARAVSQMEEMVDQRAKDAADDGLSIDGVRAEILESNGAFRSEMQAILDEMDAKIRQSRIDRSENSGQLIKLQSTRRGGGEISPKIAATRSFVERQRGMTLATAKDARPRIEAMTIDDVEAHFDGLRIRMGLPRLDPVLSSLLLACTDPDDPQNPRITAERFQPVGDEAGISNRYGRRTQALVGEGTGNLTDGDNWTPILVNAEMWAELRSDMEAFFPHIPAIPMGNREQRIPAWDDGVYETFYSPPGQDYADTQLGTDTDTQVIALTAYPFMQWRWVSDFFEADSVVNVAARLEELMRGMSRETLDAIGINSDPTSAANANVNGIAVAAGNARQAFATGIVGVRKWLNDNTGAQLNKNGAVGQDDINNLRAVLLYAGKRPGEQLIISPIGLYYKLLNIDLFRRMDAYGLMAVNRTGELPEAYRMPIISPEQFPNAFNADGRVDSTPAQNTTDAMIAVAPRYWTYGIRMMPQMLMRDAYGRQPEGKNMGMSMRIAFAGVPADAIRANRQPAALMRNITRA